MPQPCHLYSGSLEALCDLLPEPGTLHFVINDYTIMIKEEHDYGPDRELQKWVTFCKLRSQEKLDHFSRKPTQFFLITNCRNVTVSAKYNRKKNYTVSRNCELQKWVTSCKLRSQEKLDHFLRKPIQFLLIANCRNGSVSANYDRKKHYTISHDRELQKWVTFCILR